MTAVRIVSVNRSPAATLPVHVQITGDHRKNARANLFALQLFPVLFIPEKLYRKIVAYHGPDPFDSSRYPLWITYHSDRFFEPKPFDRFAAGEPILEVTDRKKPGDILSTSVHPELASEEIPVCRRLEPNELSAGDELFFIPRIFQIAVITLSDRAYHGIYEDRSGPAVNLWIAREFQRLGWRFIIRNYLIPDEPNQLEKLLRTDLASGYDIIVTTGGTGIGPRDFAPDVLKKFFHREIPGIMDMIRMKYGAEKPGALISRSVAGIYNNTLVFAIPGSVRAVHEYLPEINRHIEHLFYMLYSVDKH